MTTAVSFRSDGLDLLLGGAIGELAGSLITAASPIVGVVITVLAAAAFLYGLYLFRADYRTRTAAITGPAPPPPNLCPTCGTPLTFVDQYKRWYCQNEKKYV